MISPADLVASLAARCQASFMRLAWTWTLAPTSKPSLVNFAPASFRTPPPAPTYRAALRVSPLALLDERIAAKPDHSFDAE